MVPLKVQEYCTVSTSALTRRASSVSSGEKVTLPPPIRRVRSESTWRGQVEVGIGRIEILDVRVADVVPADIVDRAARPLAELVLVEDGLDQVLDRRVAGHAVIDHQEALAQRLLEPVGPGLAVAQRHVVGARAAERGDDRALAARARSARGRACPARCDGCARRCWSPGQRRQRHRLQQRMPGEAHRIAGVRRASAACRCRGRDRARPAPAAPSPAAARRSRTNARRAPAPSR